MWIGSWTPFLNSKTGRTSFKESQIPKESQIDREIFARISHNTKPLSCSYGNRAKMFFKDHRIASKVSPNMMKPSDSFRIFSSRVNGLYLGWIVNNPQSIVLLILLTFTLIPQRQHHLLTLLRSPLRDWETATLSPENCITPTKVESSA